MTATDRTCDVCGNASGGTFVGVAAVPGAPLSIAWCDQCLARDAVPPYVFDHDFVFVANGDLRALHDWARDRVTWVDGRYVPFDEYVQRFTPEDVQRMQDEYEAACRARHEASDTD